MSMSILLNANDNRLPLFSTELLRFHPRLLQPLNILLLHSVAL